MFVLLDPFGKVDSWRKGHFGVSPKSCTALALVVSSRGLDDSEVEMSQSSSSASRMSAIDLHF